MTDALISPSVTPDVRSGRRFYLLATAAILTAFVLMGVTFWLIALLRWPSPALRLTQMPQLVDGQQVSRGAALQYEFSYCRNEEGSIQIARSFIQAAEDDAINVTPLTQLIVTLTKGCHTVRLPLLVPASLAPGTYMLRLTFLDAAWRRREVNADTEAFRVE